MVDPPGRGRKGARGQHPAAGRGRGLIPPPPSAPRQRSRGAGVAAHPSGAPPRAGRTPRSTTAACAACARCGRASRSMRSARCTAAAPAPRRRSVHRPVSRASAVPRVRPAARRPTRVRARDSHRTHGV